MGVSLFKTNKMIPLAVMILAMGLWLALPAHAQLLNPDTTGLSAPGSSRDRQDKDKSTTSTKQSTTSDPYGRDQDSSSRFGTPSYEYRIRADKEKEQAGKKEKDAKAEKQKEAPYPYRMSDPMRDPGFDEMKRRALSLEPPKSIGPGQSGSGTARPSPAQGEQELPQKELEIWVTDDLGSPISEAMVAVYTPILGKMDEGETNEEGLYTTTITCHVPGSHVDLVHDLRVSTYQGTVSKSVMTSEINCSWPEKIHVEIFDQDRESRREQDYDDRQLRYQLEDEAMKKEKAKGAKESR